MTLGTSYLLPSPHTPSPPPFPSYRHRSPGHPDAYPTLTTCHPALLLSLAPSLPPALSPPSHTELTDVAPCTAQPPRSCSKNIKRAKAPTTSPTCVPRPLPPAAVANPLDVFPACVFPPIPRCAPPRDARCTHRRALASPMPRRRLRRTHPRRAVCGMRCASATLAIRRRFFRHSTFDTRHSTSVRHRTPPDTLSCASSQPNTWLTSPVYTPGVGTRRWT